MPRRPITPPPEAATSRPRATIDDVAREAGVSKATVSRVLNPGGKWLTPEITARVQATIDRLGYVPSPIAQGLKRGRSRMVGLVVADVANPFSVAVLRGAEKACRDAGYMVMLFNLGNEDAREREAIAVLAKYQVEGLLLHTLGHEPAALADAARHGKPVVLIDRRVSDAQLDLVGLDNAGAVRLAAGHLLEAGYRDLLFVSEPMKGVSSREERAAAFRAFLSGSDVRAEVFESPAADEATLDAALRALRKRAGRARPAVLAANAVIALRVVGAAQRLGWSLGEELGLVGFDDPDWAPFVGPGLSTIAQPTDDIGRLAVRCLIERLDGQALPARQILLPGRLVVRGSSQPTR